MKKRYQCHTLLHKAALEKKHCYYKIISTWPNRVYRWGSQPFPKQGPNSPLLTDSWAQSLHIKKIY
jgi:hypothetical protein